MAEPYGQTDSTDPSSPEPLEAFLKAPPPPDLEAFAVDTHKCYKQWRQYREPHEADWFVNTAMLRGQQHVVYDQRQATLYTPDAPTYAVRVDFNKILPKHRARTARFHKNRPKPVVVPASTEYQDLMDARATERALNYQWTRCRLESAYRDARQWASVCSKSYWWIGYDPNVTGRVQIPDPLTGAKRVEEVSLGDAYVEVGNAWEVLVKDPTKARIGDQEEILRVRVLPREEAYRRFPDLKAKHAEEGVSTASGADIHTLKQQEDRIASMTGISEGSASAMKRENALLLIERFTAPCGKYPKGRYGVVCDTLTVKYEEELPFHFYDNPTNPYPCVEFADTGVVGQFWPATWISQLIPLQRLLNRLLELVAENTEAVSRPKVILYRQHQLPEGAWTASAGEIVELNYVPGLPDPKIIQAQPVSADIWNLINLILRQFDDMSQIQTAAEGGSGGAESGYQTNLLQEASDAVHAPDIRGDELAIEDAAWKLRRIMKLTWDTPRLLALGGQNATTEMIEFSNQQINDAAEVRIQIGSMLPDLKAAKAQTALNYYKEGLLGDPADPMVRRKALEMVDMGGYEIVSEKDRLDEAKAQRENQMLFEGALLLAPAEFIDQHIIHIQEHEARMKTPEWELLSPDAKRLGYAHLITHYDFVNLPMAMGLRQQYDMIDLPIAAPQQIDPNAPPPGAVGPAGPPPEAPAPQAPPAPPSAPLL